MHSAFTKPFATLAMLFASAQFMLAGESFLTTTYQPLDGLASTDIVICPVTCHDWYSHSGQATAISLISARNVPPTNNPEEATQDLNLASICKVSFSSSDIGDPKASPELTMDMTKFAVPKNSGRSPVNIVRASLECLRRCLPNKLRNTPLTLKATDADKKWISDIVREFNAHDRAKVFYTPRE